MRLDDAKRVNFDIRPGDGYAYAFAFAFAFAYAFTYVCTNGNAGRD
jgi:hypothetical protein